MANEKYWDHLTLKDGSQVKFVPPAPNGAKLGGISATDLEQISTNKNDISALGKRTTILENLHHWGDADMTWADVANIVRNGEAQKFFQVGDQLATTWTDHVNNKSYDFVFDVVDFRDETLESGDTVPGMILQSHYATPFAIPFSNQAFYYAKDGLSAGTYNITIGTTWGNTSNVCVAGKSYQFTLTTDVPAGGQLSGFYRAPDVTIDKCVVQSWESSSAIAPIETVTPTEGSDGTSLGTYYSNKTEDAETQNYLQSLAYGHNRWSHSAYRQYLNSNQDAGKWWEPKNNFDRAPQGNGTTISSEFLNRHGFIGGFTDDFLSAIRPVKIQTSCNTLTDGGVTDVTYDTFFLPSLEEIYVNPQISGVEGEAWEYWKEKSLVDGTPDAQYSTNTKRITTAVENHSSAQYCRLRSANRGYSYGVWLVYTSGFVSFYYASNAYRCAPACVIC